VPDEFLRFNQIILKTMSDLLKKTIMAGLGAMSLTREKAEELTKDLIKRGEVSESEEAKFVKDLMDLAEKNKSGMEEKIEQTVEKALAKMNLPSRKEVNELKEEISKLVKKGK
jgi:polyhydroxyalkanoate synthesis regulator phasin